VPSRDDDLGLAETTASGSEEAPDASRDTVLAGDAQPTTARPASRLAAVDRGRYAESGELARGGLGRILRARDRHLGRTVALKEMLRGGYEAERRFVREALITARLEHPSIVPVHDAGRDDSGAPFYAMKLVGGRPLTDVFASATTTAERLAIVPRILAVADAIAYAHSQKVIHRDLKPGNVLCGEFGETVVIDWGLAKDLEVTEDEAHAETEAMDVPHLSGTQTVDGAILGTPAYMAPEQAAGADVDERADVYAIGAMLYELLSGAPPHRGDTLDDVLRRVIAGDLEPLQRRAPDVPADLGAIVAKSMQRDPAARYRSARELADDLRRYVTGQLVAVYEYGPLERLARWIARNKAPVVVAGVATLILAVVGVIAIRRIIAERDEARAQRKAAELATEAARERGDDLLIEQARAEVAANPTRAVAILAALEESSSRWSSARVVAADAAQRGIADVLVGHVWSTESIAIDAEGRRVASLGHDGIRIWDLETRSARQVPLPAPCATGMTDCTFGAWTLEMSADGRWLAAGAAAVTRWDLADLERWDLAGAGFAASPPVPGALLGIEADGRVVVRRDDKAVIVDPGGAQADVVLPDARPTGTIVRMASSPDGKVHAWHDGISLHVRNPDKTITYIAPVPQFLAVSRDGSTAHWVGDGLLAWLTIEPADLRTGSAPPGLVLAFEPGPSPDQVVVATDTAVTLAFVDGERRVLLGSQRPGALALSADGRVLAVGGSAVIPVWELDPVQRGVAHAPREPTPPGADVFETYSTAEMATSADGTVLAIDWMTGPAPELWLRKGDRFAKAAPLPVPPLSDLSVSPDGKELLFADDDGVARITLETGKVERLGNGTLTWYAFDGASYSIDENSTITRWNRDGSSATACRDAALWSEVKVSPDGTTVAAIDAGAIVRCRLADDAVDQIAGAGALKQWSLRDDGAAAAGYDAAAGRLVVLDRDGRHELAASSQPTTVRISADGRWVVAVAAEGGFTIVDVETRAARPVAVAGRMVGEVAFLPGDAVAVLGERNVIVADLATGAARMIRTPSAPGALAAFPDGALVVTASGRVLAYLDDLPHDPAELRAWIADATDARIGPTGVITSADPFREP
jgi:tRNA A-37 threonylcarbamoyl transferase component Bud32/WD40 repeat protein